MVSLDLPEILELRGALDEINQHPDNVSRSETRGPKGFLLGEVFGLIEDVVKSLGYILPEPFFNPISALAGRESQRLVMHVPSGKEGLLARVENAMIYVSWQQAGPKGHRVKVNVDLDVSP
jgi:hypothetical protein